MAGRRVWAVRKKNPLPSAAMKLRGFFVRWLRRVWFLRAFHAVIIR
jgi:hypothetical protein